MSFRNPFVFNRQNQKGVQHGFDSATAQEFKKAVADYKDRKSQAVLEHFRFQAVDVVSELINRHENNDFVGQPSEDLDDLVAKALDGFDGDDAENLLLASIADFFDSLDVAQSVVQDMFSDDDDVSNSAIEQACQEALANLPDDDELDDFIDEFCYSDIGDDEGYDSAVKAGATTTRKINGKVFNYVAVKAIRNGDIVVVNKRKPNQGKPVLSQDQRNALKKAQAKAHSPNAIRKQMKSIAKGIDAKIYTNMAKAKQMQGLSYKHHNKALSKGTGF